MIVKYCRWCNAPFNTFTECWAHQDQCVDGDYDHDTEQQQLRELTVKLPGDEFHQ